MQLIDIVTLISDRLQQEGFKRVAINYVSEGILFAMTKNGEPYLFSIHRPKAIVVKESGMIGIVTKKPKDPLFTADSLLKQNGMYI